jgi:peptide deformylase
VLVNPEIVAREGTVIWTEGCLSVPDFTADVERAERVRVRGLDLEGREVVEDADDLRAVCFQHELDHLDGVLFIDRISRLKRSLYVSRRKKAARLEQEAQGAR